MPGKPAHFDNFQAYGYLIEFLEIRNPCLPREVVKSPLSFSCLKEKTEPNHISNVMPGHPQSTGPLSLIFDESRAWTDDNEFLCFDFLGGKFMEQQTVLLAVEEIKKYTDVPIRQAKADERADIRISFDPRKGTWSYIGKEACSVDVSHPTMNLALNSGLPNFKNIGLVIHELLHALGCLHEHSHPNMPFCWNEDEVLNFFKEKYAKTEEQVWKNILKQSSREHIRYTEYDQKSIMHYPILDRSLTNSGIEVGRNYTLSETDKKGLRTLVRLRPICHDTSSSHVADVAFEHCQCQSMV